jgi:PHD/YefM family antitoxin component YafN of YafNO toxin-antitoxin module
MLAIHPQYIKDSNGSRSFVILPANEFDSIIEELEDLEDVRLYDEVKKNDSGERMPMDEAFKLIEAKRKNK